MNKMIRKIWTVAVAMLAVGCAGEDSPAEVVEKCWDALSRGEVAKAVELMAVGENEKALYVEMFDKRSGALQSTGGVEKLEVTGLYESAEEATVEAIVRLKDGQEIEATYKLIKREGQWLIAE